jgi:hypothetical protein
VREPTIPKSTFPLLTLDSCAVNDLLGYLAATMMGALAEKPPIKMRLMVGQGLIFVAPALGMWRVYESCIKDVNRLSAECKDEALGAAILNNVNGVAYSAKGELKQSTTFFLRSGQSYLKLRDSTCAARHPNLAHVRASATQIWRLRERHPNLATA